MFWWCLLLFYGDGILKFVWRVLSRFFSYMTLICIAIIGVIITRVLETLSLSSLSLWLRRRFIVVVLLYRGLFLSLIVIIIII